jgi:hypothetical protein
MSWANYDQKYITSRVEINSESGCWEWTMQLDNKGYGRCGKGSGEVLAHRLSYSLFVGEPGRLFVLHKCDNPRCCNPEHLFLGTQAENVADACAKGRHNQSPLSTLKAIEANRIPEEKRSAIILLIQKGISTTHIAHIQNISERTIRRIKQGLT